MSHNTNGGPGLGEEEQISKDQFDRMNKIKHKYGVVDQIMAQHDHKMGSTFLEKEHDKVAAVAERAKYEEENRKAKETKLAR